MPPMPIVPTKRKFNNTPGRHQHRLAVTTFFLGKLSVGRKDRHTVPLPAGRPLYGRCCGSYMGHRSVALTWSSVVDDRPDRSSRTGWRHRRNVWCECSSKSIHCSKVHGSYHPRTIGLGSFTRRPVWTRRASHPAPSGRPPRGGAKVAWFRYSCEYLGYSREDSSCLITCPAKKYHGSRIVVPYACSGVSIFLFIMAAPLAASPKKTISGTFTTEL